MRRTLRHLVLWLCMAALPLQGLAAAAMLHCQHGHGPAPGAAHSLVAAGEAVHEGCDGQGGDAAQPEGTASSACSACAACCAGWALWPVLQVATAAPEGAAPLQGLNAAPEPFVASGPERPPRSAA